MIVSLLGNISIDGLFLRKMRIVLSSAELAASRLNVIEKPRINRKVMISKERQFIMEIL